MHNIKSKFFKSRPTLKRSIPHSDYSSYSSGSDYDSDFSLSPREFKEKYVEPYSEWYTGGSSPKYRSSFEIPPKPLPRPVRRPTVHRRMDELSPYINL